MYEKGNSKFFGKARGLLIREMLALVRAGIVIGVVAGVFLVLFATPAWAATQSINGDPVDVNVYDSGKIEPYYDNWPGKYQYYSQDSCNNVLWLNGGSTGFNVVNAGTADCGACTDFTAVSNSKPDPWTIETVYDAGSTGVRITQRIEYVNGTKYYNMYWSIENTGSTTYTDLRFIHGGDTYFGGDDYSNGHYDSGLDMVYLTNFGVTGIMGLLGTPSSPIDHYYEADYWDVTNAMCSGNHLPDTVNPSYVDAGYAVEWDRGTLAPGEVWEITSIEKWTTKGNVQVFAPAGQSGYVGDTFDYNFIVQNLQSFSDTFDLSTSSSQGWTVSLPGGSTVTIGASSSKPVLVRVTATSVGTDLTTLTATSQSDPTVTNDDSVTTQANPPSKPEIRITKSAPTSVAPGGTITYTINYSNVGGVDLTNVTITENYPKGITFISATPAPDPGTNNMWSIGSLPVGTASKTITIKVKVPESPDLTFTESGSVTGEGFVMVSKDLSSEQKPYRLKNVVTITCAETDSVSASASTTVGGVPGTSLSVTEHGSGIYESEEILNLETKNKSISLQKTTEAEYKPTAFTFSDGFAVNFTTKWKQDICSKNTVLDDAMHKKITAATYIKDDTKTEAGEYGTEMAFESSFYGAAHIGVVSKDVTTSEDYIGEFELFWAAKEECQYLFNWSRVPGNDSEKLIRFLVDTLDIIWAENATITKSDDDRIINISIDVRSAEVILAANNETAAVKVGNELIYVLDVRTEDGTLNVYDCRLRQISESVTGEGYVMIDEALTSGHMQVVEHGSGIYSSDTCFDSQRLNKSTEAEYKPTTFNFSNDFGVNFSSKWVQDICSKDKKAGTAIHKRISNAASMTDDTTATKSSMEFETSFNGSIHIGARTNRTRISEDYIGVFNLTEKIKIGRGVIPIAPTPTPDWLSCPFPKPGVSTPPSDLDCPCSEP